MLVQPGYYSYNISTERDTDDSLFRELVRKGALKIAKTVYYQGGERVWILFYVPSSFELGPIDGVSWSILFREAEALSKPEDTIPLEELEQAKDPLAETLEENILKPVEEAKNEAKRAFSSYVVPAAVSLGVLLIITRRS